VEEQPVGMAETDLERKTEHIRRLQLQILGRMNRTYTDIPLDQSVESASV
jgi:hypothetical protein